MPPKKKTLAIEKLELKKDDFLYKTTLLMGLSGTGKTKIIIDIMHTLKDDIPTCYIFSPTNKVNDSFTGIVPDNLITDEVDVKTLEAIYKTQEKRRILYKTCNDKETLITIAFKLNESITTKMMHVNFSYKKSITKLQEQKEEFKKDELDNVYDNSVIKILKEHIEKYYNLETAKKLNEEEINIVKMMNMNINMLLIFDDCAASSKTWGKTEIIKKLFFQGRHLKITTIISLQNDKELLPGLRQNAFITFFTSSQSMTCFFKSETNGYTKEQKDLALAVSKEVFKKENRKDTFKKGCYIREKDAFYFFKATLHPKFIYNEALFKKFPKESKSDNIKLTNDFIKNL